ncbi:DnaJ-domain-containing protein [Daldinia sp. FL1419]|nr:DnaJ-domain-containing protein [Daldinia sp. FL1419]
MPPFPSSDCYAILGVDVTATRKDIVRAYHRLAFIYHPDKNPQNQETATAAFQEIERAYTTLKDPVTRYIYDRYMSVQELWRHSNRSGVDNDREDFGENSASMPDPTFPGHFRPQRRDGGSQDPPEPASGNTTSREAQREEEREKLMQKARKEKEAKEAQMLARKRARMDAKQAQEEMRAKQKGEEWAAEVSSQKGLWKASKSTTADEKMRSCLHSKFCGKIRQPKKFKCGECHMKRGTIVFECPHCQMHICQKCVTDFAETRARLAK